MNLTELGDYVSQQFTKTYGRPPRWIAAAPGRVNVIGEHTDYNDGFVLPMAIERYTVIAAERAPTQIQLRSTSETTIAPFDPNQPIRPAKKGTWSNYPAGVIAGFIAKGIKPGGFDALIHSTVPLGGGLSSSAALEVATATLLEAITGKKLDPVDKALLCQKAEHEFAGVPCGIMDQFISVMAKKDNLLLLDCRSREAELVPMNDPGLSLLIINTNVKHELSGGEYAKRRAQCEEAAKILGVTSLRDATLDGLESAYNRQHLAHWLQRTALQGSEGKRNGVDEVVHRRARHVITEIARTLAAAQAVRASDWAGLGRLMYESHRSLRDQYEVSCAELDAVVDIARTVGKSGGVLGCRMTGGGFGGCAVALVETERVTAISDQMAAQYEQRTGIKPSLFVSRPAAGATVLRGQ